MSKNEQIRLLFSQSVRLSSPWLKKNSNFKASKWLRTNNFNFYFHHGWKIFWILELWNGLEKTLPTSIFSKYRGMSKSLPLFENVLQCSKMFDNVRQVFIYLFLCPILSHLFLNVRKCSILFEIVRQFILYLPHSYFISQLLFENVRKCSKMFENVRKCSKMFENVWNCSTIYAIKDFRWLIQRQQHLMTIKTKLYWNITKPKKFHYCLPPKSK